MKKLIFVRHGKTKEAAGDQDDFDRELQEQGVTDSRVIGMKLNDLHVVPDQILGSSAIRAIATAQYVAKELGIEESRIKFIKDLYSPSFEQLLDVIRSIDDSTTVAMLVGHNPGFAECANYLGGSSNIKLSTCCFCGYELAIDSWEDIVMGSGKLLFNNGP